MYLFIYCCVWKRIVPESVLFEGLVQGGQALIYLTLAAAHKPAVAKENAAINTFTQHNRVYTVYLVLILRFQYLIFQIKTTDCTADQCVMR